MARQNPRLPGYRAGGLASLFFFPIGEDVPAMGARQMQLPDGTGRHQFNPVSGGALSDTLMMNSKRQFLRGRPNLRHE